MGLRTLVAAAAVALAAAAGAAAAPETAPGDPVTFRFAPPGGTKFVQTLVTTSEQTFEGLGSRVQRTEAKTALEVRKSNAGYVFTAKQLSIDVTRDGEALDDPLSELLKELVITLHVSADGQLDQVDGYGDLAAAVAKRFPPEVAQSLAPVLKEETLVAREIAEWNGRIGDLAGASVRIGDAIDAEVPFTLPNGESLVYYTHTRFAAREPCGATTCVRVEVRYDSDAAALAALVARATSETAAALGHEEVETGASDAHVSGSVTRLIDPDTMLIYAETISRTIAMTIQITARGPVPTTMVEARSYAFEYE